MEKYNESSELFSNCNGKPLKSVNDAIQFLHYVFSRAIEGGGIKEEKGK